MHKLIMIHGADSSEQLKKAGKQGHPFDMLRKHAFSDQSQVTMFSLPSKKILRYRPCDFIVQHTNASSYFLQPEGH